MQRLVVRGISRARPHGKMHLGALSFSCALGRNGRGPKSGEGDGVTPIGCWPIRHVFYRPDRMPKPKTALSISPLSPDMGWCDAPGAPNYNRLVKLPYAASHERLWRKDGLYDIICVLGYNDLPRIQGRGSAIFMHIARQGYKPTEGCIALSRVNMLLLLSLLRPGHSILIDA